PSARKSHPEPRGDGCPRAEAHPHAEEAAPAPDEEVPDREREELAPRDRHAATPGGDLVVAQRVEREPEPRIVQAPEEPRGEPGHGERGVVEIRVGWEVDARERRPGREGVAAEGERRDV